VAWPWHHRVATRTTQRYHKGATRGRSRLSAAEPYSCHSYSAWAATPGPQPDHKQYAAGPLRDHSQATREANRAAAAPGCPSGATHCSIAFNTCAVVATQPRGCRRLCGPFVADRSAPHGQPRRGHPRATTNSWPGCDVNPKKGRRLGFQ